VTFKAMSAKKAQ